MRSQNVSSLPFVEGVSFVRSLEGIHEYRLESNGLQILFAPDPTLPVAGIMVTYHVGSRNEAIGYTGATHLLEHLMFKGSDNFNKEKKEFYCANKKCNSKNVIVKKDSKIVFIGKRCFQKRTFLLWLDGSKWFSGKYKKYTYQNKVEYAGGVNNLKFNQFENLKMIKRTLPERIPLLRGVRGVFSN